MPRLRASWLVSGCWLAAAPEWLAVAVAVAVSVCVVELEEHRGKYWMDGWMDGWMDILGATPSC